MAKSGLRLVILIKQLLKAELMINLKKKTQVKNLLNDFILSSVIGSWSICCSVEHYLVLMIHCIDKSLDKKTTAVLTGLVEDSKTTS